jgi:hypothetical protein
MGSLKCVALIPAPRPQLLQPSHLKPLGRVLEYSVLSVFPRAMAIHSSHSGGQNSKVRCGQDHGLSDSNRGRSSLPLPGFWFLAVLAIPWLVNASPTFLRHQWLSLLT